MTFETPAGTAARVLLGLAGALLGAYIATLGFESAGRYDIAVLPGRRWLVGLAGLAFAAGSIFWVFSPAQRD